MKTLPVFELRLREQHHAHYQERAMPTMRDELDLEFPPFAQSFE
jgi:hypothetical protein